MAKTVIRPAAEEDIPAIIALYRQLDSAMVALQPEFFCEAPREVDEIRKAVRADDADFLLAERRFCAGLLCGLDAGVQLCAAPPVCLSGGFDRGRRCARAGHW